MASASFSPQPVASPVAAAAPGPGTLANAAGAGACRRQGYKSRARATHAKAINCKTFVSTLTSRHCARQTMWLSTMLCLLRGQQMRLSVSPALMLQHAVRCQHVTRLMFCPLAQHARASPRPSPAQGLRTPSSALRRLGVTSRRTSRSLHHGAPWSDHDMMNSRPPRVTLLGS